MNRTTGSPGNLRVPFYRAIICPHGFATSWVGISRPGERLPAVEHCEDCNPDAVALNGEAAP